MKKKWKKEVKISQKRDKNNCGEEVRDEIDICHSNKKKTEKKNGLKDQ